MKRSPQLPLILAAAAALSIVAAPLHAAPTGTVTSSTAYGLTLTVSTRWLDGAGYRPVEVSIVPATPPKADQTLHIEFHASEYYYPGQHQIVVSQDIDIPAGSTQVVETIAVPQHFSLGSLKTEVWLDGRFKPKLTQQGYSGMTAQGEALPNILVVSGALNVGASYSVGMVADPDSSRLASIFPAELVGQQMAGRVATATPAGTVVGPSYPTLITVPYNHLPKRWIELSTIDLVCVSLADLKSLKASEPQRWRALRDWTAAGGNLLVSGVGGKLVRRDEVLNAFNEKSAAGDDNEWMKPDPDDFSTHLNSPYASVGMVIGAATAPGTLPPESEPPFMLRRFGSGMIVAVAADNLFDESTQNWVWMLNSLSADRWLWYRRHGLSLDRKNADFWNWLIRGVGLAPVTEFRILITVFVLAIGPVNYFWLRRRGRLHLLVVIVPLAAMAVTLSLFGYAMVADGLDVRVRARTFTQLDQRTHEAVCWSRLSYYAGLAPSNGLMFPDDVAVIPLTANDNGDSDMARRQSLAWSPQQQHLASGWLASRTPTQLVTVRSRSSQAALRFLPPRGSTGPQVENQLGTRVIRLLLADEKGKHFRATDISAGGRASLEAVDPADEEAAIFDFAKERQPSVPEGFVLPTATGFSSPRAYRYRPYDNALAGASLANGLLETQLRDAVMGPGRHVSWSKPKGFELQPKSYLAIVERSPEVLFGVDGVREEDSLHIVVGSW